MSRPLPIRQLATLVHTSERQLERAFRRETGTAPNRYFRRLRLQHSYWLLKNSDAGISQIAYDCGFSDNSHFTRAFLSEYNKTPTKARLSSDPMPTPEST